LGVNPNIKQSDVLTENHAIQAIIKRGIDDAELRNEIYAQAIKCIINNEDQYVTTKSNCASVRGTPSQTEMDEPKTRKINS
jgi:hypothetical protein